MLIYKHKKYLPTYRSGRYLLVMTYDSPYTRDVYGETDLFVRVSWKIFWRSIKSSRHLQSLSLINQQVPYPSTYSRTLYVRLETFQLLQQLYMTTLLIFYPIRNREGTRIFTEQWRIRTQEFCFTDGKVQLRFTELHIKRYTIVLNAHTKVWLGQQTEVFISGV